MLQAERLDTAWPRTGRVLQRKLLYHYTDKAGYEGINQSKTLRPSVLEGKAHTHYGRGIYFTKLDPFFDAAWLGKSGMAEQFFGKLGASNRSKMQYFFEIDVDENEYPMRVVNWDDPSAPYSPKIWIVERDTPMPIEGRIRDHGQSYFQQVEDLPQPEPPIVTPGSEGQVPLDPESPYYLGIKW